MPKPSPRILKASEVQGQVTAWQPSAGVATGTDAETAKPGRVVRKASTRPAAQPFEVAVLEPPDFPLPPAEAKDLEQAAQERRQKKISRAEIEAEWEVRLEEATAQALEQGKAEGYAQAQADLQAEINEQKMALTADVAQLKHCWSDFIGECETLLAQIAFEVAEALLDAPLPDAIKEATAASLTDAIEHLAGEAPLTVTLHPIDYLRLQESGLVERLETVFADLRWQADPDLTQGDWIVLSPTAAIRRFKQELLQDLLHRLGLLSEVN